jgi:hypothetical protein
MLGININGEFLDLSPGTSTQLERTSPFFNSDSLSGEYSLPFSFPYTPRNARLLGLPNHFYTKRIKAKIPARLYDNNNFSYTGELVVEAADLDVNDVTRSRINGYFLTGVSSFFQAVKNKKLKELTLGGVRNFAWTDSDPDSFHVGFWQIAHRSLAGTMEFSFAPIVNEMWSGNNEEGTPDWMNKLNEETGKIDFENNFNTLVPQVSLKYLLQQIMEEHGWEFDYSGMTESQWETLFIPSFYAVTWQKVIQIVDDPFFEYAPLNNISINLQNHVPPEMYITELIMALRNRYNWGFNFDASRKRCSMFPLKELANGTRKDWSKYMASKWKSSFPEDPKTFAFKNEIDGNDARSSSPDFTKIVFGDPVENLEDLPAAGEDNFNTVIFVWKLNQYYQCRYNEDDNVYEWAWFADNIYNYEPPEYNEEFTTVASTMPVYKRFYRSNGITDYYGLFPLCEQEGNWEGKAGEFVPWGLRLLFHRGLVWEGNPANEMGTVKYPYLTSICFTITQEEPDLDWSNVYKHDISGTQKGIIDFWWKDTLKYLVQSDVITGTLYLPRQELLNFSWSDIILLRNVPYILQRISEVIPFTNAITVDARRIG